jgi:hypothetical protein
VLSALHLLAEPLAAHVVCEMPDDHRVSARGREATHEPQPVACDGRITLTAREASCRWLLVQAVLAMEKKEDTDDALR